MGAQLKLLPRYIKNLGLYEGVNAFGKVEFFPSSKFKLIGYPHYFYLRPGTTDKKVFHEIFVLGTYAVQIDFSPVIIIDAGANIGLSSIFFAQRFPDATLYAVEPEIRNFRSLVKNTAEYTNIKRIHGALWHRDTMLKIRDTNENEWAFTVDECSQSDPDAFSGISLTSFMKNNQIVKIDILKIDIEGAERELFSENYDYWLKRTRLIIIELHDWLNAGSSSAVFKAIAKYQIKTMVHEGMLIVELLP